jgi:hypothetical protein
MRKEFLVQSHRPTDLNWMARSGITPYKKLKKAFSGPLSRKVVPGFLNFLFH